MLINKDCKSIINKIIILMMKILGLMPLIVDLIKKIQILQQYMCTASYCSLTLCFSMLVCIVRIIHFVLVFTTLHCMACTYIYGMFVKR